LHELATAAGHTLILQQLAPSGYSLEQHWKSVQGSEKTPENRAARAYEKPTREYLAQQRWDFITIQQYSWLSHDINTYRPFAQDLVTYIKERAPQAEVLVHQTWEYRRDDPRFTEAFTQQQMHDQLTNAYRTIAKELGLRILPVGDAFRLVDTDPERGYVPDPAFDPKTAVEPARPDQSRSLHIGYHWAKNADTGVSSLRFDGHHANRRGCYLGACVWLEVLFGETAVGNSYVPEGMTAEDARFLQEVAHRAVTGMTRP
jgi:hypothetical protein